jgi:hypothetical protein
MRVLGEMKFVVDEHEQFVKRLASIPESGEA